MLCFVCVVSCVCVSCVLCRVLCVVCRVCMSCMCVYGVLCVCCVADYILFCVLQYQVYSHLFGHYSVHDFYEVESMRGVYITTVVDQSMCVHEY